VAIDNYIVQVLQDYHNMKMTEKQTAIDALVAENARLTDHIERLTLDLALKETDQRSVTK